MDGVTDAAFRRVVASQGTGPISLTEFTNVNEICRGPDHLLSSLIYSEAEWPIVAQLYGKDPEQFYRAAQVVCAAGVLTASISIWAARRRVYASGSGAALIKTCRIWPMPSWAAKQGWRIGPPGSRSTARVLNRPHRIRSRLNYRRSGSLRRAAPAASALREDTAGVRCVVVERWVEHLLECVRQRSRCTAGRCNEYRGAADWTAIAEAAKLARGTETIDLRHGASQYRSMPCDEQLRAECKACWSDDGTLGAPWFFREKEQARAFIERFGSIGPSGHHVGAAGIVASPHASHARSCARQYEAIAGLECFARSGNIWDGTANRLSSCGGHAGKMFGVSNVEDVERIVAEFCRDLILEEVAAPDHAPSEIPLPHSCAS